MEFNFTKELIYKNCAKRIEEKIKENNISHRSIYKTESKIISRIINCRIDKNRNPYLIQDNVRDALKDKLVFESYQVLLWGSPEEITYYLPIIFQHIIFDLLSPTSEYKDEINNILCGYVPYARYSAYRHLLFESQSPIPGFSPSCVYGVDKLNTLINIDAETDSAIAYLFSLCQKNFAEKYLQFADETLSFSRLDKKLMKWIMNNFILILRSYTPSENSLGIRIKNLINSDYLYVPNITFNDDLSNPDVQSMKKLVSATEIYIKELEKIQSDCFNINLFK